VEHEKHCIRISNKLINNINNNNNNNYCRQSRSKFICMLVTSYTYRSSVQFTSCNDYKRYNITINVKRVMVKRIESLKTQNGNDNKRTIYYIFY